MDYGFDWAFFAYFVINAIVCCFVAAWTSRKYDEYREKKFLKHLRIEYPDSVITLSTVATSDKKALDQLKEQLDKGL